MNYLYNFCLWDLLKDKQVLISGIFTTGHFGLILGAADCANLSNSCEKRLPAFIESTSFISTPVKLQFLTNIEQKPTQNSELNWGFAS